MEWFVMSSIVKCFRTRSPWAFCAVRAALHRLRAVAVATRCLSLVGQPASQLTVRPWHVVNACCVVPHVAKERTDYLGHL